jgi:hypothetical protein
MLSVEFVLSVGLGLFLLSTMQVSAQPLTKDTPTGNLTEVDISIDPLEPLPANGTVTISTEGATDSDMSAFPPEGVYVIISSDSVTVTNQTVDIGMTEEEEDGTESVGGPDEGTESVGGPDEGTESVGGSDDDDAGEDDDEGTESVGGSDDDDAGEEG